MSTNMEQPASSSGKFLSRLRGQKGEQRSGEQQQQQQQQQQQSQQQKPEQEPKKLNQMTKRFSRSSSSKTAKATKTPAHQVLIGRGGTTNTFFPHPGHIAFTSLDNGVGVFFKIDYNRCFAAHIYARVHEAAAVVVPGGVASSSAPDVVASRDQALSYIAREVGQKLEYECAAASWLQRSSKAVMRRSLRLVAHRADGAGESLDEAVRMAVADGVRRWLGMVEEMGRPLGQGRAFVVDEMGGEVERQEGELGEERWDLVPVKAKVGGWRIRVGVEAAEQQ